MEGLLSLSGVPPLELEVLPLLSAGLALEGGSGPDYMKINFKGVACKHLDQLLFR